MAAVHPAGDVASRRGGPLPAARAVRFAGRARACPSAAWLIMPIMPSIAARPLLRSTLSLKVLTSGSS